MPSRSLFAILLLVVLTTASLEAPAQEKSTPKVPPGKAAPPPPVTTSTVYFRTRGKTDWRLFGYYASEPSAKRVFNHLAHTGFEVKLEITNTPIPKVKSRPTTAPTDAELISMQKCTEVFAWLARQKDIAYRFPMDGCYARAHLMIERLQKNGFKPRKIWSVANGEELFAKTRNHPRGFVTWGYHVAPVLGVRQQNARRWYVIDPSLFDKPTPIAQWVNAQMRSPRSARPYVTLTKLGQAPIWVDRKRKPGTGYWPGSDPRPGLHEHAVAMMKKYKPWQGKDPPRGVAHFPQPSAVVPARWADLPVRSW